MSNYTQTTNFTAKDSLASGDPLKVIKGSYFDTEFAAIVVAIASKSDSSGVALLASANVFTADQTIQKATSTTLAVKSTSTVPAALQLSTNSAARGYYGAAGAAGDLVAGSALGDVIARVESGSLLVSLDAGASIHHKFASTAAASTLNGIAVTDFARLSQANVFTANQTQTLANSRMFINSSSGAAATLAFQNNGTTKAYFGVSLGASSLITGDAANDTVIRNEGGNILFSANSGTTAHLKLANDGTITTPNGNAAEVGYKGVPVNTQNGNYTLVLTDASKLIEHASGGVATFTIPANASVAFPIGTVIVMQNHSASNVSIAITSDTLVLAGSGSTGTRTLDGNWGIATITKITSTVWTITGTGVS